MEQEVEIEDGCYRVVWAVGSRERSRPISVGELLERLNRATSLTNKMHAAKAKARYSFLFEHPHILINLAWVPGTEDQQLQPLDWERIRAALKQVSLTKQAGLQKMRERAA